MSTRTLYQFPISHYCEKARSCLDVKGLTYSTRDLIPGLHLITAASTLAPLVGPPGSPYASFPVAIPPAIEAMIEALRARPAGKWVLERYRCDRKAGRA